MNPARLVSLISPRSVDPRRDRCDRGAGPEWTAREVGIALAGLSEPFCTALRFRWARDMSALPALERALLEYANELRVEQRWPQTVQNADGRPIRFPARELVRLALLEEHYPAILRKTGALAAMLNVQPHTYRRRLRGAYTALRGELDVWCSIAFSHVARRL